MSIAKREQRSLGASTLRWAALPGVVFLIATMGIGGAGYSYQHRQEQLVRMRAEEQLSAVSESKVSQIVVWWRERAGDARLCVSTPLIAEPALALAEGNTSPGLREGLAILYRNLIRSYHYHSACLADARGRVLLKVGDNCASRSQVASLVARALQDGEIVFSDLMADPSTGEEHLAVVAPLQHGSARAAVVLRMDARDFLYPLLRSWPTWTETGEVHLVRHEGDEVVDLSEPQVSWGSVRGIGPEAQSEPPPALAVLNPREPLVGRDRRGERVLAVARAVPGTNWFVVAKMDAKEFEGPARQSGRAIGTVVGLLGLVAAGVLALWSWRQKRTEELLRQSEETLRGANVRLQDADRRKDEFLGMLSHELRNPLAPIHNSLHVLEHARPGSERAMWALGVIRRQTGHLTRLVSDLLDVTRISRRKIELQLRRVDARELVRRACDDNRTMFRDRGIALSVEAPVPTWVNADETRVVQIVGNLLQNACKFGRACGSTVVSVGASEGRARIVVRDDGIGIAPEFLPRVFEPFVQADTSLARTQGGLGLGLALVKEIVALHGGTVLAQSEGTGHGAEFIVMLPLASAPSQPSPEPWPASPSLIPRKVLVIDDNVDEASSLSEVVQFIGHLTEIAFDGHAALEKARTFRPDVILCDIGLPGMNGYEVARTIRGDPELATAKLVAITGYAGPEDVAAAREAGFDQHIAKPASLPDLEAAMGALWGDARGVSRPHRS